MKVRNDVQGFHGDFAITVTSSALHASAAGRSHMLTLMQRACSIVMSDDVSAFAVEEQRQNLSVAFDERFRLCEVSSCCACMV